MIHEHGRLMRKRFLVESRKEEGSAGELFESTNEECRIVFSSVYNLLVL